MRKSLSFLLLYILCILIYSETLAQEKPYSTWSIKPEVGLTKIRDITSVQPLNAGIALRKMFNTKFGAELNTNFVNMPSAEFSYAAASLQGVVNVGRVLEFEEFTKNYTILSGVGGTYTYSKGTNNNNILHRISNFHLSAFVDNEYRINNTLFLNLGLDLQTGVNSRPFVTTTSTLTTTLLNFNVGVTINLGNKEHADWYLEKQVAKVDTIYMKPTIIDKTVTNNIATTSDCNCDVTEYVYFKHDSAELNIQALNAIEKTMDRLKSRNEIVLRAYCSNLGNVEYNKQLALRRAESVKEHIRGIGIQQTITIEAIGIDTNRDKKVFDMARRVQIIIK